MHENDYEWIEYGRDSQSICWAHFLIDKILNRSNIAMSYSNYDLAIRSIHKVELHGWPLGIKFTSPSNVGALAEIKILHDAIKSGECTWVAMN